MRQYNFKTIIAKSKGGHYEGINISAKTTNAFISARLADQIKDWRFVLVEIDKTKKAIRLSKDKENNKIAHKLSLKKKRPNSFSSSQLKKVLPHGRYLVKEQTAKSLILIYENK